MKILIIDRDDVSSQLIASRLSSKGHELVEESVKNNALTRLEQESFDIVFINPSPLANARPIVLNIRRTLSAYPYIILTSHGMEIEAAMAAGANDVMPKPLDAERLEDKMRNASAMLKTLRRIGDDSEDFPSAGGVIAKSAFNQLFLSAIDRADRYGEQSFILFISVSNYEDVLERDGPYAADYAVAKLSQYLVRLRRQSDIIAQTARYEYALLLQRPAYDTEPVEAASRFAENLHKYDDIVSRGSTEIEITINLMSLPSGASHACHIVGERVRNSEKA